MEAWIVIGAVGVYIGALLLGLIIMRGWGDEETRTPLPPSKAYMFIFVAGAIVVLSGVSIWLGLYVFGERGKPLALKESGQIEGRIHLYDSLDDQLIVGQLQGDKIVCRVVPLNKFHPSELEKFVLPQPAGWLFENTPHGVIVTKEVTEP